MKKHLIICLLLLLTVGLAAQEHVAVDLGLPSGLKWASCNIGASVPDNYGDFFAWGETAPRKVFTNKNSKTHGVSFKKLLESGIIGQDGNLTPQYDAAHVMWGGDWRMPTKEEIKELLDPKNCTCTWSTEYSVKGCVIRSKTNGNTIFIPVSGSRYDSSIFSEGYRGFCWSASVNPNSTRAYTLSIGSGNHNLASDYRSYGMNIRPVTK